MMMKKLPVGVENFEELRTEDFYYVDKTGFIRELLNHWGKVNLFTRPRRFGKSLNMSMLKYFFEYGCNETLFEGLEIAGEQELCQKYRGNFPVISITLKGVSARHFDEAKAMLRSAIGRESLRFFFSGRQSGTDKRRERTLCTADKRGYPLWSGISYVGCDVNG